MYFSFEKEPFVGPLRTTVATAGSMVIKSIYRPRSKVMNFFTN